MQNYIVEASLAANISSSLPSPYRKRGSQRTVFLFSKFQVTFSTVRNFLQFLLFKKKNSRQSILIEETLESSLQFFLIYELWVLVLNNVPPMFHFDIFLAEIEETSIKLSLKVFV